MGALRRGLTFDQGREPLDASLARALDLVPPLKMRFERIELGHPIRGSHEYADRLLALGEHPGLVASGRIASALDHIVTWYRVVAEGGFMPAHAHLSLLRPSFEGGVQARWVLDATVAPTTRVQRAVAVVLDDLDEQRKLETAMRASGWSPSTAYADAVELRGRIESKAAEREIALISMRDTTSLVHCYRLFKGETDVAVFRITSGVLHSTTWAGLLGEIERSSVGATMSTVTSTGSQSTAVGFTAGAAAHIDAAVKALEAYVEPR